eukprot:874811-Prymnesium_polylepis.2
MPTAMGGFGAWGWTRAAAATSVGSSHAQPKSGGSSCTGAADAERMSACDGGCGREGYGRERCGREGCGRE